MKKTITAIVCVLFTTTIFAQAPQKISYQAVIRNSTSQLVQSANISMQISILQGTPTGSSVYVEQHVTTTNANGVATIEIGNGTALSGLFANINWANGPYFIKSETDLNAGTNYTISGTNELLSVPYALYAKTAESVTGAINETDPTFLASPANGITTTSVSDWQTAYSWGNHAGLYLPTSYVPAWANITGKPVFSTVATSGNYTDLTNKPTLSTVATSGSYVDLTNKPVVASSVIPRIAGKGQRLSVSFSGGDAQTFSQSSSTCPSMYADVLLKFTQGSTTIIYPTDKYFIDSKRFDVIFDIPAYVPSGLYDIILSPSTPCSQTMSASFKIY
jgi:hypothetical protein